MVILLNMRHSLGSCSELFLPKPCSGKINPCKQQRLVLKATNIGTKCSASRDHMGNLTVVTENYI